MAYKMFPSSLKSLDGVDVEARVSMQEQPVQSAIIEPRTNTVVEGDTIDVKVTNLPSTLLSLLSTQFHRMLTNADTIMDSPVFPTEQRRALSALRLLHPTYTARVHCTAAQAPTHSPMNTAVGVFSLGREKPAAGD